MIRAAGGVPWRHTQDASDGGIEIAVVHRPRYDDWSLPKGKLDSGEHPLLGAVREVREETGLTVRVGRRLATTAYDVAGEPKEVDYWAMEAVDGQFVPGEEVDELRWMSPDDARSAQTNQHDAGVIDSLLGAPWDTTPVIVVRHGRAGDADSWRGDDSLRPLEEAGRQQANTLAELLPVYLPTRILSADRVRCVDTVRPLAQRLGLEIDIDQAFSEDSHSDDPERMAHRLRTLAAAGEPVVVCSQGGVIPDTVTLLARRDGVSLPSQAARKGSIWTLHFTTHSTLVAADYYPDPRRPAAPAASVSRSS